MKTILLFAIIILIIVILVISLKKNNKKNDNLKDLRELTEVLKKMDVSKQTKKYRAEVLNLKLIDEFMDKCKNISGNYRDCTVLDPILINAKIKKMNYYFLSAVNKIVDNPIKVSTLYLEYLLCVAENNACIVFYDNNGIANSLSLYKNRDGSGGLETENEIVKSILLNNSIENLNNDPMIIKYARTYYYSLKDNFEKGLYTDTTKISIDTFIKIIMSLISILPERSNCNEDVEDIEIEDDVEDVEEDVEI